MSRAATKDRLDQYVEGCAAGHARALAWQADPNRGSPHYGGTLVQHVIELAEQLNQAQTEPARLHARGEIVCFCYAIECPEHAEACRRAATATRAAGGAARGAA